MTGSKDATTGDASNTSAPESGEDKSGFRKAITALYIWMGSFITVVPCTTPMFFLIMLTTSLNLGYAILGRPRLGRRVWVSLACFGVISLTLIHFTFGIFRFW